MMDTLLRSMSERMTAQLACDALQMALWRRRSPMGVIVHSDRGSQYRLTGLLVAFAATHSQGGLMIV